MSNRRAFIKQTSLLVALAAARTANAIPDDARFLLSKNGCGRATGYSEANKIITWEGKTHVAWLDSPPEGFRVRIRTRDNASGAWSPTYTLGEAHDNHGGPALSIDSQGYLHVCYFPHHHPMRYRRSLRPNDASEWTPEEQIGERLTYPTLVCGADDTLCLTCRQSNSDSVWTSNLYTKSPGGTWQGPQILMAAEKKGYAHFMDALAWSPDRKTLHLACRLYDGNPARGHTVGYMRGSGHGATWTTHTGAPLTLPVTAATIDAVRQEREGSGVGLRAAGLAIAPSGRPFLLYASYDALPAEAWIAFPGDGGAWQRRPLRPELPSEFAGWGVVTPGGIAFNDAGRLYVVLTLIRPDDTSDGAIWGNPTSEPVLFVSNDMGATFTCHPLTTPNPNQPRWLPNLERPTGHNAIEGAPSLLYTEGPRGTKNTEILANNVYWTSLPE